MRKITITTLVLFFVIANCVAQQEKGIIGYDNWLDTWTEFQPSKQDYEEPTEILSGTISKDTKLVKRNTYLLVGDVFVTNNATLTIEPGTVIMGDFNSKGSLVISKGSKLLAEGRQTDPIIFTSNRSVKKPGDWGGIFILGDAPLNTYGNESSINFGLKPKSFMDIVYGGEDPEGNSGILKYVRIEFAGNRSKDHGNMSGLTLAGVGSDTTLYNVMVSYCEGHSYNVLGGNLILVKMISFRSNQNDFNFNYGAQCNLVNSLAIRSPYVSSPDGSRALYMSSYDFKEDADPTKAFTNINAENLTLVNVSNDLESDINVGLVQEAIYVGNDVAFVSDRSVISGFSPAVILDEDIKLNDTNLRKIEFIRTYFNNCNGNIFRDGYTNNDDLESWYGSRAFNNVYSKGPDTETFIASNHKKYPDFRLRINRIIASNDYDEDDDD
ncbi:hypothetical protein [Winogradskyella alexanderae]|uniref:T9SS C-terminal target domain-containing protein n=1 Tax=Winogradskyella alexanderae TaxID=2877123 RepID=A0ABS7XRU6_9FLAO|nr:hypothetical protein [Winogradskyella alexanderae]MCA0132730.1 hypothetical protein [Winogradskyella alexanderae]